MSKTISIEQTVDIVIEKVLAEPFINPEKLKQVLTPTIRAFVHQQNTPKFHPKNTKEENILKDKQAIIMLNREVNYFKSVIKQTSSEDEMKKHYNAIDRIRNGETDVY